MRRSPWLERVYFKSTPTDGTGQRAPDSARLQPYWILAGFQGQPGSSPTWQGVVTNFSPSTSPKNQSAIVVATATRSAAGSVPRALRQQNQIAAIAPPILVAGRC